MFFSLEELHLFGQGIAKHLFELLTTSTKDNSCSKLAKDRKNYTSHIPKKDLMTINKLINASRATIPSSFSSKWKDPVTNTVGNRAVDWLDIFLYMVPTVFVLALTNKAARFPLLCLVRACSLILKWDVTEQTLKEFDHAMKIWNTFLLKEIRENRMGNGVFRPNQHLLNHITFMIRKQGVLPSYSGRSMERTNGQYKDLINSKVNTPANSGNVFERFSMFNYISSMNEDLYTNNNISLKYTEDTFQALNPLDESSPQLWGRPLCTFSLSALPCDIRPNEFTVALSNFYQRIDSSTASVNSDDILVAGRCWFDEEVYKSSFYKSNNNGSERGRHHVMFEVPHKSPNSSTSSLEWFVGSAVFFFQHFNEGEKRFLAVVKLVESQSVQTADQYTPIVTLYQGSKYKIAVCQVEEIICHVGLVRTSLSNTRKYKVISHYTHIKSLLNTVGALGLL